MRAACWMGRRRISVEHVPDPQILNARDAIVRVTATSICGADLHLYDGVVPGVTKGDVLGHEAVGVVVDLGRAVDNLRVGDRVIVPFPIACGSCEQCALGNFACCENSNPEAALARRVMGRAGGGALGYSHLAGGFAGAQAEYLRVPYADVGPIKVSRELADEQLVMLSDALPTGYMAAEQCDITPRKVIAVWGAGPIGQLAMACARMLGAERVIAIDHLAYRLDLAIARAGATHAIDFEAQDVAEALDDLTAGRGPDACIDAVGMAARGHGFETAADRVRDALRGRPDRPSALRQAILACRNCGIVSVAGMYTGPVDRFPVGAISNRGLTLRAGRCHVQRYLHQLVEHVERGDLDPAFVVSHRMTLDEAPLGYDLFARRIDDVVKVVLRP